MSHEDRPYDPYEGSRYAEGGGHMAQPTGDTYRDSTVGEPDLPMPRRDFFDRANTPSMHDSPRAGSPMQLPYLDDPQGGSTAVLPVHNDEYAQPFLGGASYRSLEKEAPYLSHDTRRKRRLPWALIAIAVVVVVAAVIIPVYFFVIRKHNTTAAAAAPTSKGGSSTGGGNTGNSGTGASGSRLVVGKDGDTVTTEGGGSFTYRNPHGGYFIVDPSNTYDSGARAQSWTPALNETWTWGKDYVHGVNLGGWLVLEPFISPVFFQKYANFTPTPEDEWTLSVAMAADTASGGLQQLETHYSTFITEEDFAQMAGAGLNYVRLPMPYWAIETWPGEPFLAKNAWKYVVKAIEWCRKYGLRMNLEFHTMPGAANDWNHSGRGGGANFMQGPMGYANVQRGLNYVRYVAEFISQPEYRNVVTMFGVVNEPTADLPAIKAYYLEAYNTVRAIGGMGDGNGPFISIHDNFQGLSTWTGFLAGSDRIALEQHQYYTFGGLGNQPDITPFLTRSCGDWGAGINASQSVFGVTTAGEWSLGFNDCGLFVKGVTDPHDTLNCPDWDDWANYTPQRKQQLQQFALSSMDALQNWFFWTWKIGNDSVSGTVKAPLWSYQLGLENGWMPTNPLDAVGACSFPAADPITYSAWQTGGAGAGTISADQLASYPWPPTSVPGPAVPATQLPAYTATGTVTTLPTFPGAVPTTVDGWYDVSDTAGAYTTVAGCDYPDAWRPQVGSAPPCAGAGVARRTAMPEPTPAP